MDEAYQESLLGLKAVFIGPSETESVASHISSYCSQPSLKLLDVGIGRGVTTHKIVTRLEALGHTVTVVGVDACTSRYNVLLGRPRFEYVEAPFSQFIADGLFDVVLSTHALYYLGPTDVALKKMVGLLKPTGLLALSLMSRDCLFYRLHRTVCSSETPPACAEEMSDFLLTLPTVEQVELSIYRGNVNVPRTMASYKSLYDAAYIVSRKREQPTLETVAAFREALLSLPPDIERVVGSIFARRSTI